MQQQYKTLDAVHVNWITHSANYIINDGRFNPSKLHAPFADIPFEISTIQDIDSRVAFLLEDW